MAVLIEVAWVEGYRSRRSEALLHWPVALGVALAAFAAALLLVRALMVFWRNGILARLSGTALSTKVPGFAKRPFDFPHELESTPAGSYFIGLDPRQRLVTLNELDLDTQGHIMGHTGSGKTKSVLAPLMLHSVVHVAKRLPKATVCLLTALQAHGLTTEAPNAIWILIDRHARTPRSNVIRIEVVRASGVARDHGVDDWLVEGARVRITGPAKTVADCFRYRRRVGLEVALSALRDYVRRSGKGYGVGELISAAKADRVYTFMRPYLEALA